MPVQLDLNNRVFQRHWFASAKPVQVAVLNCCSKLAKMEWDAVYRDKGLRWELIQSQGSPKGQRIYSIRITQRVRAVVRREGEFLEFLSLHEDHDSAYQ